MARPGITRDDTSSGSHADSADEINKGRAKHVGSTDIFGRNISKKLLAILGVVLVVIILALGLGLGCASLAPDARHLICRDQLTPFSVGIGLQHGNASPIMSKPKKANVLVIMADDQDMLLDSMQAMPNVNKLIADQGVFYHKHYCTVAWCCPSRVNFLTGRAAHNTNVTSTELPYGGYSKFLQEGLNDNYLPVWLREAGIRTYYTGKLLNGMMKRHLVPSKYPSSWTNSTFLIDPWTYFYYDGKWGNPDGSLESYNGTHTTDVTHAKAMDMLEEAASSNEQFFMMVAPVAPHQDLQHGVKPPPVPDKYKGMYAGQKAPRTENFNPDVESGASWVRNMPKLSPKQIDVCDATHNHRLGNIAAIDVMVADFIQKLEDHGILNNTYIIYTSDNGFHIGNHRLVPGKRCPYEEDINIPLLIRGPDVAKGKNSTITNSHTDMAPTILQMLGLPLRDDFDGAPIAYTEEALASSNKSEHVNVEFWTASKAPIGVKHNTYYNNTYKALRYMSEHQSFFYSVWCTGEREFYDMYTDAQQMDNRLAANRTYVEASSKAVPEYYGRPEVELFNRLDALLMVTKGCKMDSCRDPWGTLFPGGQVTTMREAMNETYDAFFYNQPKISYSSCVPGNVIAQQGPQDVIAFRGGV